MLLQCVVTLLAVVSVLRDDDGGVKVIININMLVAFHCILVALIGYAVSLGSIPATTFMAYIEEHHSAE
ncbi:hypothetical protein O9992_01555 [Vibrio lentus]|nr:hypothetical protein [Vibrio lentus]